MTIEEAVKEWWDTQFCGLACNETKLHDLDKQIERYGIAMHNRGNLHRTPWGYVPEDQQEKARHAAVEAFQGGKG